MPISEYNFNTDELELIQSGSIDYQEQFDEEKGDYIRIIVFDQNDNYITQASSFNNSNFKIYRMREGGNIYVKPNEIFETLPQANYKFQFDYLRNSFSDYLLQPEQLFTNSGNFTDWNVYEGSMNAAISEPTFEDPDGGITAQLITDNDSENSLYIYHSVPQEYIDPTKSYLFTIYLKHSPGLNSTGLKPKFTDDEMDQPHLHVNWNGDGTIDNLSHSNKFPDKEPYYKNVGNGWYKIFIPYYASTFAEPNRDLRFTIFPADWRDDGGSTGAVYAWHPQMQICEGSPNECTDEGYINSLSLSESPITGESLDFPTGVSQSFYIITQISPSRKEVRLLAKIDSSPNLENIDDKLIESFEFTPDFVDRFTSILGNPTTSDYKFDYVLNLGLEGLNIPIVNYSFDYITEEDSVSLVLRLTKPIPSDVSKLHKIQIEKELIPTQIKEIYYVSDHTTYLGDKIPLEPEVGDIDSVIEDEGFQSYNDLAESGSLVNSEVPNFLISSSYPNLNINYNSFDNHVFFGSAAKKLENFKDKVGIIEGYYNEISASLVHSASHEIALLDDEELLNPTFFGGLSAGWADHTTGSWNFGDTDGIAEIETAYGSDADLFHDPPLEARLTERYVVRFDVTKRSAGNVKVCFGAVCTEAADTEGTFEHILEPTGSGKFTIRGNSDFVGAVDNISLKKLISKKSPNHISERRKFLFNKIQEEISKFTPYERFLYYDAQSESTSSAPNLGVNLTIPQGTTEWIDTVEQSSNFQAKITHTDFDGLGTVYQHTTRCFNPNNATTMNRFLLTGPDVGDQDDESRGYHVHHAPFYHHSGSIYLSFLAKADATISNKEDSNNTFNEPSNQNLYQWNNPGGDTLLPRGAFYQDTLVWPTPNSGSWRRFVAVVSQSHWRPSSLANYDVNQIGSWGTNSPYVEILSSSEQIIAASDASSSYPPITLHGSYSKLGTVITGSGIPFSGSVLPAGGLFHIGFNSGSGVISDPTGFVTSSYIADLRISLNDPRDCHPFSPMPKTGSTTFSSWYDVIHESASRWDTDNIHSLQNNLPLLIREDTGSLDLKTFLNMVGEHFDLIRNHVDSYVSLHKREYKKTNSVSTNLMPAIASSLGWELIAPFTGSIREFFGGSDTELYGGTTTEKMTHDTWRKILNNLIYLYKSRGTLNSVDALVNIYGYPSDTLSVQEYGASTTEHNPTIITNDSQRLLDGVGGQSGSVSFVDSTDTIYSYIFNPAADSSSLRHLNTDWWMNEAVNLETVELMIKPHRSINNQVIVYSSGSSVDGASGNEQILWQLKLISSGSSSERAKVEFRLNNSMTGSADITGSAVSMSTDYYTMKGTGRFWNLMLQRTDSTISGSGEQTYKLAIGSKKTYDHQNLRNSGDVIDNFQIVSMSVSGGIQPNSGYRANQNWSSTGSRHMLSSSNLNIGTTYSGSMSEFRVWNTQLSASKFKQHILNYRSTVGNHISSSQYDLIYHYPMNENHKITSSIAHTRGFDINKTPQILDSNKNNIKDFSISISSDLLTGSSVLYDIDTIKNVKFSVRSDGSTQHNKNKILINPPKQVFGNLDPRKKTERSIYSNVGSTENVARKTVNTNTISITRSPQDVLDNFIINHLADFDISQYYSDPLDLYKDNYPDLEKLRNDLYENYNISININKWIRAQSNFFNPSLIKSIEGNLPAKSTTQNVGIEIRPTLLDKSKYRYKKSSVEYGSPNIQGLKTELEIYGYETSASFDLLGSEQISPYENTKLSINEDYILTSGSQYIDTKDSEIDMDILIDESMEYSPSNDSEINLKSLISESMKYNSTKDSEIDMDLFPNESMEYSSTKDSEIDMDLFPNESMEYDSTNDSEINIESLISESMDIITPFTGSNSEMSTMFQKSFVNIHNQWGTSSSDTHFVNYAGPSGEDGFYNTGHIESRYTFRLIGDVEVQSGSWNAIGNRGAGQTYYLYKRYNVDHTNINNFFNREIIDKGKGHTYISYVDYNGDVTGPQDGRPVGRTAFFSQSHNDGQIHYPSNHYINYEDPFHTSLYEGTQNQGGYFLNPPVGANWTDLSTASFYTVNTSGDNELRVVYNQTTINPDGDIEN